MINRIYTEEPVKQAADEAARIIKEHLSNQDRVLWLLSGGSGIAIAIEASKRLQNIDLSRLFVSLTDERYGAVGHSDENWQQLLDAGLELTGANLYRPLIGKSISETTNAFNDWLSNQLELSDYNVGIFGIGADGHTAGIKPHTSATASTDFATSFSSDDFERITISFNTIRRLNEVIIQASGVEKQPVIHDLLTSDLSLNDQPAQILKTVPRATLYTNNKEK